MREATSVIQPVSPATHSTLLIEDDTELVQMMTTYLTGRGFTVDTAPDGRQGLRRALESKYDLIILDLMLPHLSGLEVLVQLRRRSETPVIILTARVAQESRVSGLDAGADDYLCKPFAPEELVARMRAVLKRSGHRQSPTLIKVGDITLNPRAQTVDRGGVPVQLTAHEFSILDLLLRAPGRVVSRDEIASVLYHRELSPFERSLDVHISHLRRKLEHEGESLIRAIRGTGYMFRSDS